jgi:hypothetical protein
MEKVDKKYNTAGEKYRVLKFLRENYATVLAQDENNKKFRITKQDVLNDIKFSKRGDNIVCLKESCFPVFTCRRVLNEVANFKGERSYKYAKNGTFEVNSQYNKEHTLCPYGTKYHFVSPMDKFVVGDAVVVGKYARKNAKANFGFITAVDRVKNTVRIKGQDISTMALSYRVFLKNETTLPF